jgi:hypothetical protein
MAQRLSTLQVCSARADDSICADCQGPSMKIMIDCVSLGICKNRSTPKLQLYEDLSSTDEATAVVSIVFLLFF